MSDDFLGENVEEKTESEETEGDEEKAEATKIKIGEEEYTQEELDRLVKLGKIGLEAEEKYQTKIDRVWPEFTKKSQRIKELERRINERETEAAKAKKTEELTDEDRRKIARAEAKKLGIVLDEDFEERYARLRAAEQLREDAEDVALDGAEKYGIKTTGRKILEYMAERGIRDPDDAFELMFKPQIRKWEREQLEGKKGAGLVTETASTAGAKEPEKPKITKANLKEFVSEALRGS